MFTINNKGVMPLLIALVACCCRQESLSFPAYVPILPVVKQRATKHQKLCFGRFIPVDQSRRINPRLSTMMMQTAIENSGFVSNFLKVRMTFIQATNTDRHRCWQPTVRSKCSFFMSKSSSSSLNVSIPTGLEELSASSSDDLKNQLKLNTDTSIKSTPDGSVVITFQPYCHRPLGCTIEESLAVQGPKQLHNPVFISKITPNGYADQAGLQVGDVIVDVSSIFGELQDVRNLGIDAVKGLVTSRPDHEVLQFRVMRGTDVIHEHERALVEIITNPNYDTDDKLEEGIVNFIVGGYYPTTSNTRRNYIIANGKRQGTVKFEEDETEEMCDPDDDAECLLDDIHNLWAGMQDYSTEPSVASGTTANSEKTNSSNKQTINRPWSSRSSPSGTFVRDPKTGKIRNIDEQ